MESFTKEIKEKKRFQFGKNWAHFLKSIDEHRIENSKASLLKFLGLHTLDGKTFLDVGSGSGLSSLSAINSGAKVFSFDYDKQSVECTKFLKEKYFSGKSEDWNIEQGSALDENYLNSLPQFDIVYSWGVLHHTGDMWKGLELVEKKVKDKGLLFLALYNDQGKKSKFWHLVKKAYVRSNPLLKFLIVVLSYFRLWGPTIFKDFLKLKPLNTWKSVKNTRGMSPHHDVIDWVGGYPFEVSKPEEIFMFFHKKNYSLVNLKTVSGGKGCNEYIFKKNLSKTI